MISNVTPVSFKGTLTRQTHFNNVPPNVYKRVESTRDEFIESYDNAIRTISEHKKKAMELDDLMYNDPDIQAAIKALPPNSEIELANNFMLANNDYEDSSIELDNPMLIYEGEDISKTPKGKNLSKEDVCKIVTMNGPFQKFSKENILKYLDNIKSYFE